jgi:hypothetical protein
MAGRDEVALSQNVELKFDANTSTIFVKQCNTELGSVSVNLSFSNLVAEIDCVLSENDIDIELCELDKALNSMMYDYDVEVKQVYRYYMKGFSKDSVRDAIARDDEDISKEFVETEIGEI